ILPFQCIAGVHPFKIFGQAAIKTGFPQQFHFFLPFFGPVQEPIYYLWIHNYTYLIALILLSAGLKYQDITVSTRSNMGPKSVMAASWTAICEITAPDIAKKKPA